MPTKDVEDLVVRIATKAERWFDKRGYGQHDEVFDSLEDANGIVLIFLLD